MNIQLAEVGVVYNLPAYSLGRAPGMAIWTQGCSVGCKGCSSPQTWSAKGGVTHEISKLIKNAKNHPSQPQRLTISGGEPLEQMAATTVLISQFRAAFGCTFEIVLYTSWAFDKVPEEILQNLDVVITEPYIDSLPATPLAGSSNQQVNLVSDLAKALYADWQTWPMHVTRIVNFPKNNANKSVTIGIPLKFMGDQHEEV